MKILQLTYRPPFPPVDGGAIGVYLIVKGLHENGCAIDLVSINTPKHNQPKDCMRPFARQYDVFVDTQISWFKLFTNILVESTPYNVDRFFSCKVDEQLKILMQTNAYDFIQLEGTFVLRYIDSIRRYCDLPILVRAHNIEYVIWERLAINEKNPLKKWYFRLLSKRLKNFEGYFYNKANAIAAITEEDKKRLERLNVRVPIEVIPAGVVLPTQSNARIENRNTQTVFFIGALDWLPNLEGLHWFMSHVWPLVIAECPEAELHVAGKSTPDYLYKLKAPNTFIHGFVDDAIAFMNTYRLMVVPLLSGGGMRVKIIEGFAAGKCILSTSVGAEGIAYTDKKNILIADTAEAWKELIVHSLLNPDFVSNIAAEARILASAYDNNKVTRKYLDLFQSISGSTNNTPSQ